MLRGLSTAGENVRYLLTQRRGPTLPFEQAIQHVERSALVLINIQHHKRLRF